MAPIQVGEALILIACGEREKKEKLAGCQSGVSGETRKGSKEEIPFYNGR